MDIVCVYFESWASNWTDKAENLDLSQLSSPISHVNLSFVQPACAYVAGQRSWQGTGLEFSADFSVVAQAIKMLKERGIKVMLSVGK